MLDVSEMENLGLSTNPSGLDESLLEKCLFPHIESDVVVSSKFYNQFVPQVKTYSNLPKNPLCFL